MQRDVYDCKPLPHWGQGAITLVGDAAHPMTTSLAQGACQAIEDAVTLGQCLRETDDIASALVCYESQRLSHAQRVVEASRRFGDVAHHEDPAPCLLSEASFHQLFESIYTTPLTWIVRGA